MNTTLNVILFQMRKPTMYCSRGSSHTSRNRQTFLSHSHMSHQPLLHKWQFHHVKCWESNSIGARGHVKEALEVNSNEFLRCWGRGMSTPDLGSWSSGVGANRWTWLRLMCCAPWIIWSWISWCGTEVGWLSGGLEVYQPGDVREDLRAREGVKDVKLIGVEVANGLGLRG